MPEIIENITDKNKFKDIFDKYFLNNDAFIKTPEISISVKYAGYQNGKVILQIQQDFNEKIGILFIRNKENNIISSKLKLISKAKANLYSFTAVSIQIVDASRKEERKNVDSENEIYISNILSDFTVIDCISNQKRKFEFIKGKIIDKLSGQYNYTEVIFSGDKSRDIRLKYFYTERKPIFVPDINNVDFQNDNADFYKFYKTSVFESDKKLNWHGIISEISVPLMYRMIFPFGYIQIIDNSPLSEKDYSAMRKLGSSFSDTLSKNKIIHTSDEKMSITDLSKTGLGIVFKERHLIKHFKDGCHIFFNVFLPNNKTVSVVCIIRNINFINNSIFKIGCEIIEMDAIGEAYYDEFI